jgi:hypothetical protein
VAQLVEYLPSKHEVKGRKEKEGRKERMKEGRKERKRKKRKTLFWTILCKLYPSAKKLIS